MTLTKEQCLKALHNLSCVLVTRRHDKEETVKCINVLRVLIEKHFSSSASRVESSLTRENPPLNLEESLATLQTLIDCQLTAEEIRTTIICLESVLDELEEGYIRGRLEKIICKLHKQREMWEKE